MRREPTFTEKRLWRELRKLKAEAGLHFRRQAPIGPYVVDFACHAARFIVEADGGIHVLTAERDAQRDAWLAGRGYRVIRFTNAAIAENIDAVIQRITADCRADTPTLNPSPQGGRGQ
jgi:very-short-patch-repair endonuclease